MRTIFSRLVLLLALLSGNCFGQTYQLTDLGAVIGTNSHAQGINNQGQVVGYWYAADGAHAFLYQSGNVTDLGLLGMGGTNNLALSINNAGQVVGFSETTNGTHAFLFQNGTLTNLGSMGGLGSYPYGINNGGQIVGYVATTNGSRAFLFDSDNLTDIGTLGGSNSFAFGINDALQVAGFSLLADNTTIHAFLWQNGAINDLNQIQTYNNGWQLTGAHAINDLGNIVGWGDINGQEHAFLYSSGVATDLGVLPGGTNSYAMGLNNSNQVVGASSSSTGNHAVFWQNGFASDLNNLIDESNWELNEARGINDSGQIVGRGIVNGQEHAFLLTPNATSSKPSATRPGQVLFHPLIHPPGSFTISLTNPVNNAVIIASSTNLALMAVAADSLGTITQVQFFQGSTSLGFVTNTPYNLVWSNAPAGNYGLTAVALDNSGNTATSSVVNITIAPFFTTNNLCLWLNPDAITGLTNNASIGTWLDSSGLSNNATQGSTNNQPLYIINTLNGYPIARFNGTNSYFGLPNFLAGATGEEAFVVLKVAVNPPSVRQSLWDMGGGAIEYYPYTDGTIHESFGAGGTTYNLGNAPQPLTQYHVYQVSSQTNNWAAWINGVLLYQTTNNTYAATTSPLLGLYGYYGTYFAGDIAEVLIFNRGLTPGERFTVNSYLNGKYGLVPAVPATPTNLVATAISQTQIQLTWDEVLSQGATQIAVERCATSNGVYTAIAQIPGATSYVDTNLASGTTYYYRVRAINLTTWSAYSGIAYATTATSGTNLPFGSLALWLKADAGLLQGGTNTPVSLWTDQSGNGNNASQPTAANQPLWEPGTIGDRPIVRFNGTNSYFGLPNFLAGATGEEAFVVLKVAVNPPSVRQSLWDMGGGAIEYYPYTDGTIHESFGAGGTTYNLGNAPQPLTQYHVYQVSSQTNNWAAWINGVLLYQTTNNTYAATTSPLLGLYGYYGTYFAGDIAEVLIFNRGLTPGERFTVNSYLNGKYGLVPAVPATPTNLVATAISQTQIQLTWDEVLNQGATQIAVERCATSNGVYTAIAQIPGATSYVDTNLASGTTYYYQVQAVNLTQLSPTSNVAYATTATSGTNLPFGSLALWLKADAGLLQGGTNTPVSLWTDQSGNGNNASQPTAANQPLWEPGTIGDRPIVRFNGTNSLFSLPSALSAYLNGTKQAEAFVVLKSSAAPGTGSHPLWQMGGSYYGYTSYPDTDESIKEDFGSDSIYNLGVPAQPLSQYHVYQVASQTNNWSAWINGVLLYQALNNSYDFNGTPTGYGPALGVSSPGYGYISFFAGDIAEVMVFNRGLTAAERLSVNSYLNGKYGLVPAVPATPTNLVATAISQTQIQLTWDEVLNQGATQIAVERCATSNGVYTAIAQIPGATSYVDTNLASGTTYYYQVQAVNLTQLSPTSNVAYATTATSGTNLPFGSLALWLKADAGLLQGGTNTPVSLWTDQSGNGNNASQPTAANQPLWEPGTIGDRPIVRFNGTNSLFSLPSALSAYLNGTKQAEAFVVLKSSAAPGTGSHPLWQMGGSYYGYTSYPDTDESIKEDFGSDSIYNLGVPAQPLSQYHVYQVASQTNNWSAWINGVLLYQALNNSYDFNGTPTGYGPALGVSSPGYGYISFFAGDIAEVMVFNRGLTAAERLSVNSYLNGKYGLVPAVPATPTNLVATAISQTQIQLTWDEVLNQGATQIAVERCATSNGVYTAIAQIPGATSYVDTNLASGTTYYYRVRAINLTTWSAYSGIAYATTATSGTNLPFGSLALWLKADAGLLQGGTNTPVSLWTDQSGNGNNASQPTAANQPLWQPGAVGGRPVVRFNGTNSYLNLAPFMNSAPGGEAFIVLKVSVTNSFQSLWEMGAYDENFHLDKQTYPYTDGSINDSFGSTTIYPVGIPAQPLTQYHIYNVTSQTNNWAAWVNGTPQYQTNTNTVGFFNFPTLGASTYDDGYSIVYSYFAGDIAEVLVFNRPLSASERDSVGIYLFSKYGLTAYATNAIPPASPTNLVATGLAPYQLNLQWVPASSNAYSFHIERKLGTNGVYQEIAAVPSYMSNYLDTTAVPTNQYFYHIKAHNLFGDAYSSAISPPAVGLTNWPATVFENETNLMIAQAADADGTVSNVQFFSYFYFPNKQLLVTTASSPYTNNWVPLMTGVWSLTALATDNQGNSQYSAPVSMAVYRDSNGDGIPDYLQVSQGNDPLNPWIPPARNTNDHTAPIITLLIPTNAVVVP